MIGWDPREFRLEEKVDIEGVAVEEEAYRDFRETARWRVAGPDGVLGDVWRAERGWRADRGDRVVCWMHKPSVLGFSLPQSAVIGGYSRTTKVGAIADLKSWHANRDRSLRLGDWNLHCRLSRPGSLDFLGVHPELGLRWIFAIRNEAENPHLGAMGGVGWQIYGRRGKRTVIVHDAADLEAGLECLIVHIGREPDARDTSRSAAVTGLPVERHYPNRASAVGHRP